MNSMHLSADIRQGQTLSPRLQHAVQLLQMSSLDFAAMVRSKMDENPFLEEEEEGATLESADAEGSFDARDSDAGIEPPGVDDRDLWLADRYAGKSYTEGEAISALDLTACPTTLAMHLRIQLNVLPLSQRDSDLAQSIIESLDDDGYLRTSCSELMESLPLSPAPTPQELNIALRLVQSFDPAGVGARSVGECLKLQCPNIDNTQIREIAESIIDNHLDALAARDVSRLGKLLHQPAVVIETAIEAIRRLNPRPGWQVGCSRVDYIVPDVIVRRGQDQWEVRLNPAVIPRVRINKVYEELFRRNLRKGHSRLVEDLHDARWTLRNVAQRFSTILDVAEAIVRKQSLFLEFGAMAMKPMLLREIASEIGVHESTVSRVTNNKYMATPLGVFELKHFFSRSVVSASGAACSPTAIRELISDIIAGESPQQPLSDGKITSQLASQGLMVARRTVTKYRQLLQIEPVEKRRRHPQ